MQALGFLYGSAYRTMQFVHRVFLYDCGRPDLEHGVPILIRIDRQPKDGNAGKVELDVIRIIRVRGLGRSLAEGIHDAAKFRESARMSPTRATGRRSRVRLLDRPYSRDRFPNSLVQFITRRVRLHEIGLRTLCLGQHGENRENQLRQDNDRNCRL